MKEDFYVCNQQTYLQHSAVPSVNLYPSQKIKRIRESTWINIRTEQRERDYLARLKKEEDYQNQIRTISNIESDHVYANVKSPKELKEQINFLCDKLDEKCKLVQKSTRCIKRKVNKIEDLKEELTSKQNECKELQELLLEYSGNFFYYCILKHIIILLFVLK